MEDETPGPDGRYAAFLRGINLGRRRVTGAELSAVFVGLGFSRVATFLASGNVVFEAVDMNVEISADDLEARIEAALDQSLGYEVPTFLRTAAQLGSIVAHAPFTPAELARSTGKVQVLLLSSEPSAEATAAALAHGNGEDRLAIHGSELYWLPAGTMSDSPLDLAAIARILGPATIRTANTLARLHRRFFADAHPE